MDLQYRQVVLRSPDTVVYLEYDPGLLPEKPESKEGETWTRFVCISDTHDHSFDVPAGDVLLHSGDLTDVGTVSEFERVIKWLSSLPHKVKIIIAGNHDLTLHQDWYEQNFFRFHHDEEDLDRIRHLLTGPEAIAANLVYLQDSAYKFRIHENGKEWSVYGSPWSPEYYNWAFNYRREDGETLVSKFPSTDILLTHCPPHQIFDRETHGSDVGCKALRARLPVLKPRLHVFGHIHEARGAYIHKWTESTSTVQDAPIVQNSPRDQTQKLFPESEGQGEITVFVNATNYPTRKLTRDRMNIFGGPGFQAVVVDLKD